MVPSFVPQCVQFAASQGLTIKEVSMPELEEGKKFLTSHEWGSIVDRILKRWEVASNCSLKNANCMWCVRLKGMPTPTRFRAPPSAQAIKLIVFRPRSVFLLSVDVTLSYMDQQVLSSG